MNWDAIVAGQARHVNDLRYLPGHATTRDQADLLLEQLTEPNNGVLSWLRRQR
jgi:hypothetical protein